MTDTLKLERSNTDVLEDTLYDFSMKDYSPLIIEPYDVIRRFKLEQDVVDTRTVSPQDVYSDHDVGQEWNQQALLDDDVYSSDSGLPPSLDQSDGDDDDDDGKDDNDNDDNDNDDDYTERNQTTRSHKRSASLSFPCPLCDRIFDSSLGLNHHSRTRHRQEGTPPPRSSSLTNRKHSQKCTKINPQTGKPCNSSFSRSYDLTRHDATIHAEQRLVYHCDLCEDGAKTFSRHDALVRHRRVKHMKR